MTEKTDKQQEDTSSEPETYQEMAQAYIKRTKNILFQNAFERAEGEKIDALQNALYHIMIYDENAGKYQNKADKALEDIEKYEKKQRRIETFSSILSTIISAGGAGVAAYFGEVLIAFASAIAQPTAKRAIQYFSESAQDIQQSLVSKKTLSNHQIKSDHHKEMFQEVCFFMQECGTYKGVEKDQAKIVFGNRVIDIIKSHDAASSEIKAAIQENILKDFKVRKGPKIAPSTP